MAEKGHRCCALNLATRRSGARCDGAMGDKMERCESHIDPHRSIASRTTPLHRIAQSHRAPLHCILHRIAQSHRATLHCILHRIAPSHRASLRRVPKFSIQQRWPFSVVLLYFWVQKRPLVTLISGSTRTTAILPGTGAVIVFWIAD